jgi:hypothetical protein
MASATSWTLTVSNTGGSGSGTVTSDPAGIDCGSTCSASFDDGTDVTLTATPEPGSRFDSWSGDCTGTGPCVVKMDSDRSVTATFVRQRSVTIFPAGTGSGTVTSNPPGVDCGSTCSAAFDAGSTVTLTATPAPGSRFAGWSGDCSGTDPCTVTMDGNKNVTATFELLPVLTVAKDGTGSGTVTSDPAGIDCGSTCSASFPEGQVVTLTATPDSGSRFDHWSGDCTGSGPCTVTMDQNHSVTATFTRQWTLSVLKTGDGTGTVTSSPGGIDCGATCSAAFDDGTVVTLTATPDSGSEFTGWTGGCAGTGPCTVTMSGDVTVGATFEGPRTLTVTKSGTGTGTVTSNPAGIDCGATCSATFGHGSVVTLTATPAPGNTFLGWSGDCAGTTTCTVRMDADHSVNATFSGPPTEQQTLLVSKAGTGTGTVSSTPAGIDCGSTCSASFVTGTVVILTATPASGSTFAGWSGDCTGTGACTLTMSVAHSVTATFNAPPAPRTLTVSTAGSGSGTVTSNPAGINCGSTCSASFTSGTAVTLTATPASGSTFAGWSGDCTGTGACTLTMSVAHTVTATFTLVSGRTLTVAKAGSGSGTVASNPAGINCGSTCSAIFGDGTEVTLMATPASGDSFTGWSGDCSGTGACTLTMNAAHSVTATFGTAPLLRTLTVSKRGTGAGAVASQPGGIQCGSTCTAQFQDGATVVLSAKASRGSRFSGWSGDCSGTGTCTVAMGAAHSVTAGFSRLPKPKRHFNAYVPPPYNYDPANELTWWNSFDVRRIPRGTKVTIRCCPGSEVAYADRSHKAHSKRVSGHRFHYRDTFQVVIQKSGYLRCDLKVTILKHTKIIRTWGRTC